MSGKGKFILVFLLSLVFIGLVNATQVLEVTTNSNEYSIGDLVEISGSLKDNGNPYPNQQIGIQVLKSNQELYFLDQTTTDSLGSFYSQVQLSESLEPGIYTVYASSSTIQVNTTFEIKTISCTESWNCGVWSICTGSYQYRTCTDSNHCGTETYKPQEALPCTITGGSGGGSTGGGGNTQTNTEANTTETSEVTETQTNQTTQSQTNETSIINETENNQTVQNNKTPITGMILATQATPYLLGIFLILSGVFTYLQVKKSPRNRNKIEKKSKVKSLRAVAGIFMLFLLVFLPSVSGYSIETFRTIPSNLNPLDEFQVSINVNFDESNLPPSAILSEKIPDGFEVLDLGSGFFDNSKNTIKWLFLPVQPYLLIQDTVLNYTLKAPSSSQTAALNGIVNIGSEALIVEGDELITIGCIEQWNCTDWSACSNNLQTRTCTDSNACGTNENKPTVSTSCNLEPDSQTDSETTPTPQIPAGETGTSESPTQPNNQTQEQINAPQTSNTTNNTTETTRINETQNTEEINLTLNQTNNTSQDNNSADSQNNKAYFTGNITVTSMTLNSLLLLLSIITAFLIFFSSRTKEKKVISQNLWNKSTYNYKDRS